MKSVHRWRGRWLTAIILAALARPLFAGDGSYRIAITSGTEKQGGLFVTDADGANSKRVTGGIPLLPAWSPNGQRIAFLSLRDEDADPRYDVAFHWPLFVVDVEAGKVRKVASTPVGMFFQWSPDGKRFVFQSSYEDPRNQGKDGIVSSAIYVIDADGKNQKRLTDIEGLSESPSWSSDGKEIRFRSTEAGKTHAYAIKPDGRSRKLAERIATKDKLKSMNGEVHLVDAEGRSLIMLTSKEDGATEYELSPDEKIVVYRATLPNGTWALFRVGVDGQNRKRLAPDVGSVTGFAFAPIRR